MISVRTKGEPTLTQEGPGWKEREMQAGGGAPLMQIGFRLAGQLGCAGAGAGPGGSGCESRWVTLCGGGSGHGLPTDTGRVKSGIK